MKCRTNCGCSRGRVPRRDFLITSGAAIGAGLIAGPQAGVPLRADQVDLAAWRPCVDVGLGVDLTGSPNDPLQEAPVRRALDDLPAPVDLALVEQNANVAQALMEDPLEGRANAARDLTVADAPAARGRPSEAPARLAAKSKWPTDQLKIYFYPDGSSVALQKRVREIADEWSKWAKIDFKTAASRADADIRIAFQRTGHWSYVGLDCKEVSGQTMNLEMRVPPSRGEYNYGVVLHEFGHALGCIHEHQSPGAAGLFDERAVIDYFRRTYQWDATKTQLNVLNRYHATQLLRFTRFDIHCIMLYSYPASITRNRKGTPQNNDLSAWDKYFISQLYPGRATVPEPVNGGPAPEPPVTAEVKTLPADGSRVEGRLAPSAPVNKYTFEITDPGSYRIWTDGYTQLEFKVARADGAAVELVTTTPDLVNRSAKHVFAAGKYTAEVTPKHAGGTGEYAIYLQKQ